MKNPPAPLIDLTGKVALVTGGSRGIGAACCRLLARAGCDVAVHYLERAEAARAVGAEVEAAGRSFLHLAADMGRSSQVESMVARVIDRFGRLDIVVENAGVWMEGRIDATTDAEWDRVIGVNLSGAFYLCRAGVPHLRRAGEGSIVMIASTAGQRGEAAHGHYAASKGGLIALTRSLAVELAPDRIRVNAVSPGWIRTDMTEPYLRPETIGDSLKEAIPLGRPGDPEDVAGPVVFLASPLARHITGAVLNVNGGAVLA